MKSRVVWQEREDAMEITFHRPRTRDVDDEQRRVHFTQQEDPRLLGEVLLRGLKEA